MMLCEVRLSRKVDSCCHLPILCLNDLIKSVHLISVIYEILDFCAASWHCDECAVTEYLWLTGSSSNQQWLRSTVSSVWSTWARSRLTSRSNHISWFESRHRLSLSSQLCCTRSVWLCKLYWVISKCCIWCTVTTCLENLEMSGNLTAVGEMSGILLKIREMSENCQGKNLVREKLPKTVYCKLHICVHTGI